MNTHTNAKLLETYSDELERLVLEEVHKRRRSNGGVNALVLPAGQSALPAEMARLGCQVTGADHSDYARDFRGRALAAGTDMAFAAVDSPQALPDDLPGQPYDIVVLRRGLCSLAYGDARRIVRQLLRKLKIGGKLYISILGLHSELGENYTGANVRIEDRLHPLSPAMARKYGIDNPVCLYSERNLFMLLMEAGGSVLRTFTTTHGSVRGIAVRV